MMEPHLIGFCLLVSTSIVMINKYSIKVHPQCNPPLSAAPLYLSLSCHCCNYSLAYFSFKAFLEITISFHAPIKRFFLRVHHMLSLGNITWNPFFSCYKLPLIFLEEMQHLQDKFYQLRHIMTGRKRRNQKYTKKKEKKKESERKDVKIITP